MQSDASFGCDSPSNLYRFYVESRVNSYLLIGVAKHVWNSRLRRFCRCFHHFFAIPGPGNLALITSTSKGGIKGGLAATLGVIAGDQVLMWLAVAGVAALLGAYPAAFKLCNGWVQRIWPGWASKC